MNCIKILFFNFKHQALLLDACTRLCFLCAWQDLFAFKYIFVFAAPNPKSNHVFHPHLDSFLIPSFPPFSPHFSPCPLLVTMKLCERACTFGRRNAMDTRVTRQVVARTWRGSVAVPTVFRCVTLILALMYRKKTDVPQIHAIMPFILFGLKTFFYTFDGRRAD